MRKMIPMLVVAALSTGVALALEIKTVVGEGQCAKCSLGETEKCQTAIQVEEGGKTVTYYLEQNPVAKKFHGKICKTIETVKATGDVEKKDGKMVMTATEIEVVE